MILAGSSAALADYFNGFETDIAGWETPTRVASGTDGIISHTGGFHATTAAASGDFTRWGGYNYGAGNAVPTVFQEYRTSVDIYLNVEGGWANNTRFDFSSAINNSAGTHLSDFIFNGGFYNDATGPGAGTDRFVISASYNSQPGSAYAKNPGFDPIVISATGWYTFEHHFYDNAGVLNVDMSIYDANGALVKTWTRVSAAIAGVGGNRYGWFDFNEFSTLAFDNSKLEIATSPEMTCTGFQPPMDKIVSVKKKSNRVLPFKMQIVDADGVVQTDADIAPPVIEVDFGGVISGGIDGEDLLSSGRGDEGNQFSYNSADQTWQFNLNSKQFTALGDYLVTAVSGDPDAYSLAGCTATFIIE